VAVSTMLLVDSNVLLHFRSMAEIDWCKICGQVGIELLLVMPVLHELDHKKSDPILRDRARRVIKDIKVARDAHGKVRAGVTLRIDAEELSPTDAVPPLVYVQRDDQIIAIAKRHIASGSDVRIVTEDMGMQVKCEAHGIQWHEAPPDYRLDDPLGEQQKQLRQLQAELASLKNRKAVLSVSLSEIEDRAPRTDILEMHLPLPTVKDQNAEMERIKRTHRLISAHNDHDILLMIGNLGVSIADIEHYNASLDSYYHKYQQYLANYAAHDQIIRKTLRFGLWLENTGSLPTEDISIEIEMSKVDIEYLTEYSASERGWYSWPEPPEPPRRPSAKGLLSIGAYDYVGAMLRDTPAVSAASVAELHRNVSALRVEEYENRFVLRMDVKKLRHNAIQRIGNCIILLRCPKNGMACECRWIVRDAVNASPTIGRVVLKMV
jgi:hypothetical protein